MQLDAEMFNVVYPIVGMIVYPRGNVELIRDNKLQSDIHRGKRDKVRVFSAASRTRLALVAKETPVTFLTMITLTYGLQFPHSGRVVKADICKFLAMMRQEFGRFEYLWFFEFQRRGAPHVHIMCTLPDPHPEQRAIMSAIWVDMVQDLTDVSYTVLRDKKVKTLRSASFAFHKRRRQWERIRHPDGAARYATKYALKMHQKVPPEWFGDVGRYWGHSRAVGQFDGKQFELSEGSLRKVLEIHCDRMGKIDILPRIIFDCFPDGNLTND